MCIQSYYDQNQNNKELELDLLSEIKDVGIEKWKKKTKEKKKEIDLSRNNFRDEISKF